jgi:Sulfotransferase family
MKGCKVMSSGEEGENLIFVISQPRSGSTLLQLILAGHPDIATTSEPWLALHPIYALRKNGIETEYDSQLSRVALVEFLGQSGANEAFFKEKIREFLLSLYVQSIRHQKKKYFLDKTPRYYYIITELFEIFPRAKFIILLRNPLAVLNSILKAWVKEDFSKFGRYQDDLLVAPGKLVEASGRSDRCITLKHEDLVADPHKVMMTVCRSLGIPFFENMLDYGARMPAAWRLGDSTGIYKKSRPDPHSVNNWKEGFSSQQEKYLALSYVEALGRELINDMGYSYDELVSSVRMTAENKQNLTPWDEMTSSGPLVSRLQRRAMLLEVENQTMQKSFSWRITAPLRKLGEMLRL